MHRMMTMAVLFGLATAAGPPLLAQTRPPPVAELRENSPNPFFPATLIPFTIDSAECANGHQPLVSLKVYNVLIQVVAIPVLQSSNGEVLDNIRLPCGAHVALWDGRMVGGRTEPTPGIYYSQLTVNGARFTRKMIVTPRPGSRPRQSDGS
ncbi:MAG: hypothetical protein ACHQXA_04080 [Gemmatimonadales bacterium]